MKQNNFSIEGHIVDILNEVIYDGRISVENGKITSIESCEVPPGAPYLMPGFVEAHMHVESTMLLPDEMAKMAVQAGTVAVICDPHEIANVCGIEGFNFMRKNAASVPPIFHFGVPSCVPATPFETSGAEFDADIVRKLLVGDDVYGLSEMMNFPAVIGGDPAVLAKVQAALDAGKLVDGHAPGVVGEDLKKYIAAGISTDHECRTLEEAIERVENGMYVLIREGSAARNFDALLPLLRDHSDMTMFCTDDLNPEDLVEGHINLHVRRAIAAGYPLWNVLRTASVNAAKHYRLDISLMRVGDRATFIAVDNLEDFNVVETVIGGERVWNRAAAGGAAGPALRGAAGSGERGAAGGAGLCEKLRIARAADFVAPNNFNALPLTAEDLKVPASGRPMKVIVASDGSLYTEQAVMEPKVVDGCAVSDVDQDMLKYVVYNRYKGGIDGVKPAVAFIKGFGLKRGALASSVAHDSHNICAVGTSDEDIAEAINLLIENKGGIVAVDSSRSVKEILRLPVAGLMSPEPAEKVAQQHIHMISVASSFGARFKAPYMTMSFMALLVIPELKLSDKGLFDGLKFQFTGLEE